MLSQRPVDHNALALRRRERSTELEPDVQRLLEADVPARYYVDGELIREFPDGRRFIVRLIDGGRSEVRIREVLSAAERSRIQAFIDAPDGAIAKARAFGTDVSQTLRNALLTPEERWRRANATISKTRKLYGAAHRSRVKPSLELG